MKKLELKKPTPVRSTPLPWRHHEGLPPENPRRKEYSAASQLDMPITFTYALIDLIEGVELATGKLSKGKARKAIVAGKVQVNGEVVRDPDARVEADDKVEFFA